MKIHVVKSGDSLYNLAKKYNVDLDVLVAANPQLANPDKLDVGMKIKVPTDAVPVTVPEGMHAHTVKQGDTMWKLSKEWGVSLKTLIEANKQLTNPNILMTGQIIYIPKETAAGTGMTPASAGVTSKINNATIPPTKTYTGPAAVSPKKTNTAPIVEQPVPEQPAPTPAPKPLDVKKPLEKLVEKLKPLENLKPAEKAKPVDNVKPMENVKPAENVKPVENIKPLDVKKPAENIKPAVKAAEEKITPKAVDNIKPISKLADNTKPAVKAESVKPAQMKPAENNKPSAISPAQTGKTVLKPSSTTTAYGKPAADYQIQSLPQIPTAAEIPQYPAAKSAVSPLSTGGYNANQAPLQYYSEQLFMQYQMPAVPASGYPAGYGNAQPTVAMASGGKDKAGFNPLYAADQTISPNLCGDYPMYPYAGAQMGFPQNDCQPQMVEPYSMPGQQFAPYGFYPNQASPEYMGKDAGGKPGFEPYGKDQGTVPYYMPYEQYGMAPGMLPMSMGPNAAPHMMPMSMGPNAAPHMMPMSMGPNAAPNMMPMSMGPNAAPNMMPMSMGPNAADNMMPMSMGPNAAPYIMPMSMGPNAAPNVLPMSTNPNAAPSVLPTSVSPNNAPSVLPTSVSPNNAPSVLPTSVSPNNAPSVLPTSVSPNAAPVIQPYQFQPYDNGKPQFAAASDGKQGYGMEQQAYYPYGEYMGQPFNSYAEGGVPGAYPMSYAPMADGMKPGFYPQQGFREGYYTGYGYQPAFPTPYPAGSYGTQTDPANPYSPMLTPRADRSDGEDGEASEAASAPKSKSAPRKTKSGGKASLHSVSAKPKRPVAKADSGNSPWINQYR